MKICIICGYYNNYSLETKSQGGAEYQSYLLSRDLLNRNIEVSYISIGDNDTIYQDNNIIIYYLRKRKFLRKLGPYYFLDYIKIRNILKRIKPNIVYVRGGSAFLGIASILSNKLNFKVYFHVSSDKDVNNYHINLNLKKLFYNIDDLFRIYGINHSTIICQTIFQHNKIKRNFQKRSYLIRNFHPIENIPSNIRKENIICWIGNLKDIKNPIAFIDLANRFNDKQYRFIMAGRKPDSGKLSKIFPEIIKKSNIEYLGEITNAEVNSLLSKSKLLCSTSYTEGFPNVFIQAWLNKVPVLSLYVNPDDILTQNKIGFKLDNLNQMEEVIRNLIGNVSLLNQYADNARKFAVENFNVRENINKIFEIINS